MHLFDASSMIHAWDNYPIEQFPGLWGWMSAQITKQQLTMPKVAVEETAQKTPDCGKWLKDAGLRGLEITDAIIQDALRIKGLLDIVGDAYHGKGVGENDIFIVATARFHQAVLVSEEGRQPAIPKIPAKRKIPSVCGMASVGVRCINFVEFLRDSKAVFS